MNRTIPFLLALAGLAGAVAHAQPKPAGFLCCNMRSDGRWISDSNYQESGKFKIPLGTPAEVVDYARYRVSVKFPEGIQTLGNDYSRELAMPEFARRYIVTEDPQLKLAGFPKKVQDAITSMRVQRGMTKEQVLMAIGYPIASETPHLDLKVWKYWLWTFSPFQVHFDERGVVTDIQTDPDTRMRVVMD